MPRDIRRRSEIVDSINAAMDIVDDVAQDEDGDLVRAVMADLAAGHIVEGGSTITQQLAKNLFLTRI